MLSFVKIGLTNVKQFASISGMDTDTTATTQVDTTILRKAGLTESQAKGYLALIEHGQLSPVELAAKTSESRTNGYQICEKLEKLGLATKKDARKSLYVPENPTKLRHLIVAQQKQLKNTNDELSGLLPQLLSSYRLVSDKPGVLYLEGVESLQTIYDDIIRTGQTLRIFPSAKDRDDPEIAAMIDKQIARQRAAGIKTETLIRPEMIGEFSALNDELFEARTGVFTGLDAQIMVYGPNVTISTFTDGFVTTIITNQTIADTFMQLFQGQWNLAAS